MLFRQLFERESSTFTYLIASRPGGEALLIDPVKTELSKYFQLIDELGLRLVFAVDTHMHADHVTALGDLRAASNCATLMGEQSSAAGVLAGERFARHISIPKLRRGFGVIVVIVGIAVMLASGLRAPTRFVPSSLARAPSPSLWVCLCLPDAEVAFAHSGNELAAIARLDAGPGDSLKRDL
jgi:hypothetical protein